MSLRQLKAGYFVIEGLNSFATTLYLYYFYFFMQKQFGFGNMANLWLAAFAGGVYMVFSLWGGRLAQRYGYFRALKFGFLTMMLAVAAGAFLKTPALHVAAMGITVIGMCFTWPTLEALVTENETHAGVQQMVGIYNIVWASTGAVAYFSGGAMLQKWGMQAMFIVPASINLVQLLITLWLEAKARPEAAAQQNLDLPDESDAEFAAQPPAVAHSFKQMAWLANPFAYISVNTLVAVMPGVAAGLGLSTMAAGFVCSLWCFSRLGAFVLLWKWNGWHFSFRWLLAAFLGMVACFAAILMIPNLAVLIVAQAVFGGALGLIYSSSLFYSMHGSEAKGEHGGVHEAAIGLGNLAGPAVGASSLWFFPHWQNSGAVAVTGLLLCGLGGLAYLRRNGLRSSRQNAHGGNGHPGARH